MNKSGLWIRYWLLVSFVGILPILGQPLFAQDKPQIALAHSLEKMGLWSQAALEWQRRAFSAPNHFTYWESMLFYHRALFFFKGSRDVVASLSGQREIELLVLARRAQSTTFQPLWIAWQKEAALYLFMDYQFHRSLGRLREVCTDKADRLCVDGLAINQEMIAFLESPDGYMRRSHSRWFSALLAFLLPGSGHLYNLRYEAAFLHVATVSGLSYLSWHNWQKERFVTSGFSFYLALLFHLHNIRITIKNVDEYNEKILQDKHRQLQMQLTRHFVWWPDAR